MTITANLVSIFDSFLLPSVKPLKPSKPCRIRWRGQFIVTHSGKTIWPSVGAAKNAFSLHCGYHNNKFQAEWLKMFPKAQSYSGYVATNKNWPEFVAKLEADGLLEFVLVKAGE